MWQQNLCAERHETVFLADYAAGNFTEEVVATTPAPSSATRDPVVQVIDVVPHESGKEKTESGARGAGSTAGGQASPAGEGGGGGRGRSRGGGEETGDRDGGGAMLDNNPPYGN